MASTRQALDAEARELEASLRATFAINIAAKREADIYAYHEALHRRMAEVGVAAALVEFGMPASYARFFPSEGGESIETSRA